MHNLSFFLQKVGSPYILNLNFKTELQIVCEKVTGCLRLNEVFATSHCVTVMLRRTEKMQNYSHQFVCSDGFYDTSSEVVTKPMSSSNMFLKFYTLPKTPYKGENFPDVRAMGIL
jgi:hypothetical protein